LRRFLLLPLFGLTACVSTAMPANTTDASVVTWTRLYCTPDNESHFETMSAPLEKTNFAPPASPIYIGGGGPAKKVVFGGFESNWGAGDVASGKTHPTPVVQWITVLAGSMVITTTDGDSRRIRAGDIIHLEDVAPCRGHITHNESPGATFLQFVQ
jgi:hypothetical protein